MKLSSHTSQIHQQTNLPSSSSYQMRILSVIGICFVVLGHLTNDLSSPVTFGGWFPYYSFHMPLFLFISGYFFRDLPRDGFFPAFGKFFLKKCKNLMLPYYVINGCFILMELLLVSIGFVPIYSYTFPQFLAMPWVSTQPITWSIPTWFLAGLFLAELYFALLRGILTRLINREAPREIVIFLVIFAASIGAVYLKHLGLSSDTGDVYLRSIVMVFFLEIGFLYRRYAESFDRLPHLWYFLLVFAAQFLIILLSGNSFLSPSLASFDYLGKCGITYMATGITGILLWLRVAKILALLPKHSKVLIFIGENTKYIMAFHLFGFFLLNTVFYFLHQQGLGASYLAGFNEERYFSQVFYACLDNPRVLLLYFLAGMGFSLLLAKIILFFKQAADRRS